MLDHSHLTHHIFLEYNKQIYLSAFYIELYFSKCVSDLQGVKGIKFVLQKNAMALISQVHTLTSHNSTEIDIIIDIDGSAICNLCSVKGKLSRRI